MHVWQEAMFHLPADQMCEYSPTQCHVDSVIDLSQFNVFFLSQVMD